MSTTENSALNAPSTVEETTPKLPLKVRFANWRDQHPFKASALESSSLGALYGVSAAVASVAASVALVAVVNRFSDDETEEETEE